MVFGELTSFSLALLLFFWWLILRLSVSRQDITVNSAGC